MNPRSKQLFTGNVVPALLALALLILPAQAEQYMVLGMGTRTCGEFVKGPSYLKQFYVVWAQGFITGVNIQSDGKRRMAGNSSHPDALTLWLEKYCKAKPLAPLAEAAEVLADELAGRAAR